jgi:phospholipid/cholesterol/gamma-HCH transport system substrate-binding protein
MNMKKNAGNKIKLGVFVSMGILLFIIGIYFIGDRQQMFSKTFRIKGMFKDVNGLKIGNNVRFSGINVGTIENIEIISDSCVRVDMTIEDITRKFIKKDATAIIGSEGLMGNKIMSISPGTSDQKPIENNDFIKTTIPINIDDILVKIKVTADNAAIISSQLGGILTKVNSGNGTIGRLLQDSTIAENINTTIVNLKKGTKGLDENMQAAKHNFLFKGYFRKKNKEALKKKSNPE